MSYYKTNAPQALAAIEAFNASRDDLLQQADVFAARFGGKGALYSDPARFAGVEFATRPDPELWRNPDTNRLQCPRSRPRKGATAATKEALAALNAEWNAHAPKGRVSADPVYQAIGKTNSLCFAFTGLSLFVHDGWLYAKTATALPQLTEILGSEYDAADAARRKVTA